MGKPVTYSGMLIDVGIQEFMGMGNGTPCGQHADDMDR